MQNGSAEAELRIFGNEDRSVSGDAELQIFSSQGRAEVRKRNFTSLEVQTEMTCGSGTSHLWKSWQKKFGSETWDLWKSWQSEVRRAELQIFASQGRAEVWKSWTSDLWKSTHDGNAERHYTSSAVKTERKRNFRSLGSRKSGSAESELKSFSRQDKGELRQHNLTSLTVSYPTDCHCQRWKILTAILKNNVNIMYG